MTHALREWLHRWNELVPARDRIELVSPPIIIARMMRYAVKHHWATTTLDDVRARDPEFVALMLDLARIFSRVFRLQVEGVDNVPASGPVLLVGNHNGGLVPTDTFFTLLAIFDRFGPARAVSLLAHDFLIEDDLFQRYARRLGVVRANHEGAHGALRAGNALLVYPGGDVETFRTFRDRKKIDLAQRTGFIALALREHVPIVPVVSAGTHEQFVVLSRGDRFARRIRLHEWARTEVFPLVLALPWGLTSGFFPYLPLPAQTSIAFGEPIRWPSLDPEDPAAVLACVAEVEARMQTMLDRLYAGRRFLLGRPRSADARARRAIAAPL